MHYTYILVKNHFDQFFGGGGGGIVTSENGTFNGFRGQCRDLKPGIIKKAKHNDPIEKQSSIFFFKELLVF